MNDVHKQRSEVLAALSSRRSVSPRRLAAPAPDAATLQAILQAALSGPDHGDLHPWRVLEFPESQRGALADLFEQEKLRRDPLACASDRERAREHALRPPLLLAFIVSLHPRSGVPEREQWLAAGAALGNLLNAAHLLGFGAIVLSGDRCFDADLQRQLGLCATEELVGFISVGTVLREPPQRSARDPHTVWTSWPGQATSSQLCAGGAAHADSNSSLKLFMP